MAIKVQNHIKQSKVKEDIQDILRDFMHEDANTLELLKNNSKTIGGVLGAEYALHERMEKRKDVPEEFFFDKKEMDLQDITFK